MTILSVLSLAGFVVLGLAMLKTGIMSHLNVMLFVLGHAMIIIFMDLDKLMFIGTVLMLIGILPLSIRLFHYPGKGSTTGFQFNNQIMSG